MLDDLGRRKSWTAMPLPPQQMVGYSLCSVSSLHQRLLHGGAFSACGYGGFCKILSPLQQGSTWVGQGFPNQIFMNRVKPKCFAMLNTGTHSPQQNGKNAASVLISRNLVSLNGPYRTVEDQRRINQFD